MESFENLQEEYGLKTIAENIDEGLWIYDRTQKKYIFFSDEIERIYERKKEEFQTNLNLWTEVIFPEDKPVFEKASVSLLKTGVVESKYRIILKNNELRWVKDKRKLLRDSNHFPRWVIGIVTDISDSNKNKEELSESDASFQILFHENITPMCIYEFDTFQILEVNPALIQSLGYRYDELLEKKLIEIVEEEDRNNFLNFLQNFKTNKRQFSIQESFRFVAANGNIKTCSVLCFYSHFHKKESAICLFFDKTEIISYEEQIRSLAKDLEEQNENLKKIAFLNAHKIRGPLTSLISLVQIISQEGQTDPIIIQDLQKAALDLDTSIKQISETIKQGGIQEFSEISLLAESTVLHVDDDLLQLKITNILFQKLEPKIQYLPYSSPLLALNDLELKKIFPSIIFLDLNMDECDGWRFLEEMEKKQLSHPVIIVSSTVDVQDYKRSKMYFNVKGFLCKPLTTEKIRDFFLALQN
ncbi:MAG: PAS domain-containing protein [Leptospiraceae bacterium]|nr:PAS domain-containing protein [Leptospiraceae bacterium]